MSKTTTQEKLEAQLGKPIQQILRDALEARKGQKNMVARAALDLDLADATFYQWAREFGINIDEYHAPRTPAANAAP